MRARHGLIAAVAVLLWTTPAMAADQAVFEGPAQRAQCGPGSLPEPALQGEVPAAVRQTPREIDGFRCNLELIGNYPGEGASWQDTWYRDCAYYDTKLGGGQQSPGVQVLDVSDSAHPRLTANLTSIAMLDPWESLVVNQRRGLLAGVAVDRYNSGVGGTSGAGFFDVYDVSKDCRKPELKSSALVNGLGHEGEWAPDGMTYYATSIIPGVLTAIDVSDPTQPKRLISYPISPAVHGLSVSDDGNRVYLADIADQNQSGSNGMTILDVSDIQKRAAVPQIRVVGDVTWPDGSTAQMTIPVTIDGHPYVIETDEGGNGGARIIDIADEAKPRVVAKLKLEIQMPENAERSTESGGFGRGGGNEGTFAYNAHYCGVPQRRDPGVVACSYFESGVRVFDIRDPLHPKEIAYFNPGGNGTKPVAGSHRSGGTSAYTSARVRVMPDTGELWFTDQDKGFYVVRFTNGVWPFPGTEATGPAADLGLPAGRRCASRRHFRIRLRAPRGDRLSSARVYVNGKRVRVLAGRRLRAAVDLRRLPEGTVRVTIVARTRKGRTVRRRRTYHTCVPRRGGGVRSAVG